MPPTDRARKKLGARALFAQYGGLIWRWIQFVTRKSIYPHWHGHRSSDKASNELDICLCHYKKTGSVHTLFFCTTILHNSASGAAADFPHNMILVCVLLSNNCVSKYFLNILNENIYNFWSNENLMRNTIHKIQFDCKTQFFSLLTGSTISN